MAAVAELCFLLFALISNIHAEELLIKKEKDYYMFNLSKEANCLISRVVGEKKLVLWKTSDHQSENSTLPEDLKERLFVFNSTNIFILIFNLTRSNSGLYHKECWTEGKVTYEQNISIVICSSIDKETYIDGRLGGTVDLPCSGAADLDIQWLKREFIHEQEIWTRVFRDNTTSVTDKVKGRNQVVQNTSALRLSSLTTTDFTLYTCLVMNQQQCVSSHTVGLYLQVETIYRTVEETAVLPCAAFDPSDDQPPGWFNFFSNTDLIQQNQTVDQNYSLVLSSLTLNHSELYLCKTSTRKQLYALIVCPKFGPAAVELFSEGEKVTLRCRDWEEHLSHRWFIKSNQTEGRVINIMSDLSMSRVRSHPNGSLVISNVSLKDTGEYWCAVTQNNLRCVSTTKTLLKYREPFGIHSTFYTVRCSVLSGLLLMLCVVVVAVNLWSRRGGQLS